MNTLLRAKAPHSGTAPRQLNETASKQAVEIEHLRKTYSASTMTHSWPTARWPWRWRCAAARCPA
jgi:hypothetical protein